MDCRPCVSEGLTKRHPYWNSREEFSIISTHISMILREHKTRVELEGFGKQSRNQGASTVLNVQILGTQSSFQPALLLTYLDPTTHQLRTFKPPQPPSREIVLSESKTGPCATSRHDNSVLSTVRVSLSRMSDTRNIESCTHRRPTSLAPQAKLTSHLSTYLMGRILVLDFVEYVQL